MKNKDKYDLRRLDIIDCKRSSILDSHINSIEIEYDGRLVGRITYATVSGLKIYGMAWGRRLWRTKKIRLSIT